MNYILFIGAALGFLSVIMGTFADHVLRLNMTADNLRIIFTALRYNQIYAVVVVAIGMYVSTSMPIKKLRLLMITAWLFIFGIIFFSLSIYIAVLFNFHFIKQIAPLGGVSLMIAWLMLCYISFLQPYDFKK